MSIFIFFIYNRHVIVASTCTAGRWGVGVFGAVAVQADTPEVAAHNATVIINNRPLNLTETEIVNQ